MARVAELEAWIVRTAEMRAERDEERRTSGMYSAAYDSAVRSQLALRVRIEELEADVERLCDALSLVIEQVRQMKEKP